MPHLTLEYTANLPSQVASSELFARLHRILADVAGIDIGNCKSRAIRLDTFLLGEELGREGFVHLDVRLMEGKTVAVQEEVGRRILDEIRGAYAASDRPFQATVEIREIVKARYFKLAAAPG
jgi:5-carboxymethyl-2-hydroxymuconate isomerase